MRGFKNKRVLITRVARGIGAATAVRFLEEGARVIVLDCDEPALFAFLASDDAEFITGQYYVIDGGETAGSLAGQA
jgi:NAD(P)-dependent dehydrogenase (short-subunit alcohol dehydrogenase family)